MTYSLGVDLGTTYSAAAVREPGSTQMVSLGYATTIVPSAVFVTPEGEALVGEAALRRGATTPDRLSREFKRRIGDSVPLLLGGSPFSAEALTGRLLAWIVGTVVEQRGEAPDRLAVTYPANWGPFKHDRLVQALRLADLAQVATGDPGDRAGDGGRGDRRGGSELPTLTLTEPEAAAISYAAAERVPVGEVVAVYDLGGGTFDGAVLRKAGEGFEVLGTPEGIEQLGGIDIDEAVFRHVAQAVGDVIDGLAEDDPVAMRAVTRLRQECVEAKEALSSDTDVSIPVVLPGLQTEVRLTRMELEAMVRPVLDDTVRALRRAIASADLAPSDVDRVLLVGGSSRMPLVAELVTEALERPVFVDAHPKHAVALGAALAAAGLPGAETAARPVTLDPDAALPPPDRAAVTGAAGVAAGAAATARNAVPGSPPATPPPVLGPSPDPSTTRQPDDPTEDPAAAHAPGGPRAVPDLAAGGPAGEPSGAGAGSETGSRSPADALRAASREGRIPPDWDGEATTLDLGPTRDPLASPTLELPDSLRPPRSNTTTAEPGPPGWPAGAGGARPAPGAGGGAWPPTPPPGIPAGSGTPSAAGGPISPFPDRSPGVAASRVPGAVEEPGLRPPGAGVSGERDGVDPPGDAASAEPSAGPDDLDGRWGPDDDAAAGPPGWRAPAAGGRRRGRVVAAGVAVVAVLVIAVLVLRGGGDGGEDDGGAAAGGPASQGESEDQSEGDGEAEDAPPATPELAVEQPVAVGEFPDGIAAVDDQLVVASTFGNSVSALDVASGTVDLTAPLDGEPLAVLVAEGSVWVTQRAASTVARIDPASGDVLATIDTPGKPVDLAFAEGTIWVAGSEGVLSRIDPATDTSQTVAEGIATLSAVVADGDQVWVTHGTNGVGIVDPATNQVTLDWGVAGTNTDEAVLADSGLWVLNRDEGTVSRLDPDSGEELARVDVGTEPAGIVVDGEDGDRIWVIDNTEGTVVLIDGPSGQVLARQDVGDKPLGLTTTPGRVWVTLSGANAVAPVTVTG